MLVSVCVYPNSKNSLLLNEIALLLKLWLNILVEILFYLVAQNENVNLVIGTWVDIGALINTRIQFVLLFRHLLLKIFNLFFNDSLRVRNRLSRHVKHLIRIIVLIHIFKNLLAYLERLLLLTLRIFFIVFFDDACSFILASFALDAA